MLKSINPYNQKVISEVKALSKEEISKKINLAKDKQKEWKKTSFKTRSKLVRKIAEILREKRESFASLISKEMGMPISQSVGEVEKTAQIAEYYADKTEEFLSPKHIKVEAKESYVSYEALGVLFHVAPWNFPIYLGLRPIIPAIMAGNVALLKHASSVPQISQSLEGLFIEAGFEPGVFQSLLIGSQQVEEVIRHEAIKLVTVIGSERAGSEVAKIAGEEIKKTIMELGGSDAFMILDDADLDKVFPSATKARLRNCGQSCNAAKRFIVHEKVAKQFLELLKKDFESYLPRDPLQKETQFGPLANLKALEGIKSQVEESLKMGSKILVGGHGENAVLTSAWQDFYKNHKVGYFYPPTILTDITVDMPVWKEEIFAPVAPIMIVQSLEEAIQMANNSKYGLSASIWTEDLEKVKKIIPQLEVGNVFINSMVRSNIKMPYGGVKKSGYGRELGKEGLMEMVNIKTVVIK